MFLYLSKLLPLLFYPLGLACVLMVVALITIWKRPRWAAGAIALALVVLLVSSNGWTTRYLLQELEWQHLPPTELPTAEAIVVLGGATQPATPPRPGVDLLGEGDRIFYAAQLYQQKKAPVLILSGGRINWQGSSNVQPESADMAVFLRQLGIPETAIIQEPDSLNTYQNAVNVKQILDQRQINRVLLVTSALHMPRSLLIFQRQGIAAIPAPTDFLISEADTDAQQFGPQAALLNFLPDADRLKNFTRALKEYIGLLVYSWRGWL